MDDFNPLDLFGTSPESEGGKPDEPVSAKDVFSATPITNEGDTVADEPAPAEQMQESSESSAGEKTLNTDEDASCTEPCEGGSSDECPQENTASAAEDSSCAEQQSDKFDMLLEAQKTMSEKIDELEKLFNARILHTDHEEKIVDRMHKELQQYKDDMYAQLVRPILMDVIEMRDSIMRIAATYMAKPEGERDIPNKTFSDYAYDLQDILEKNSVEIYRSKSGDEFVPVRQRVIRR